jgi:hypothetical protein
MTNRKWLLVAGGLGLTGVALIVVATDWRVACGAFLLLWAHQIEKHR